MIDGDAIDLDTKWLGERYSRIRAAIGSVIVGQEEAIRLAVATVLSGGHSLYEGVPGLAKTLLVRTLAASLGTRFGRIQFTPDLMPSDIVGSAMLDSTRSRFEFHAGPLFTDFLLADEINRAPAKTQAALLEAMQEHAATVDGERHDLGEHFTVFATQNPIEQEGTYPLPEAELDRFQFKIALDYPSDEDEFEILRTHHGRAPTPADVAPVLSPSEIGRARALVRDLTLRDDVIRYASALVRATRADPAIAVGASPRAGLWLLRAAKALAALDGRDYALPEDVQAAWLPTLRHRIVLEASAEVEGQSPDDALGQVLRQVPVPK